MCVGKLTGSIDKKNNLHNCIAPASKWRIQIGSASVRLTKIKSVQVRLAGRQVSATRKSRAGRVRGQVMRGVANWQRCLPHVRRAVIQQQPQGQQSLNHQVDVQRIHAPSIDAKPQSLLKAWRCLSAALFVGAITSPALADMEIPEFGDQRVSFQLRQAAGGGGSEHKYYLGVGAGASRLDSTDVGSGFSLNDESSEGAKVFFGKYFSPRWRWEIGYTDAGSAGVSNGPLAGGDLAEVDYKIPSIAIDYLLRKPSAKLNFYLRGGAALVKRESDDSRIQFEDESEVGGLIGAGLQWRLSDRFEARFGLENYAEETSFAYLALAGRLGKKVRPMDHSQMSEAAVAPTTTTPRAQPNVTTSVGEGLNAGSSSAAAPDTGSAGACKSVDRELNGVTFDTGSAALTPLAKKQLDRVASALKRGPNIRVTVRGYTDSRGNSSKNQLLSQKRARAVASYLTMAVGNFNNAPRAVGMGESNPIASNDTAGGRARNRRIELNLRAGDGCDDTAIIQEVDDKTRLVAENIVQSAALRHAEAAPTPVVAAASVSASYGSEQTSCKQINHIVKGVHFGVGEFELDGAGKRAMMPILAALRNDSTLRVQVKGHTDSIGLRAANQVLSGKRARSVAQYLMSQAPKLTVAPAIVGAGEMYPIASNGNEAGRARNRRIEIALVGGRNCHLPAQHAGAVFEPAAPVSKRFAEEAVSVKAQDNRPLEAVALLPQPTVELVDPIVVEEAVAVQVLEEQIEVEAQVQQEAVVAEVEQNLEVIDQVSTPVAKALEDEAFNSLPVGVAEPIAEPTLSDTINLAGGESPVATSQACNGIDRIVSGIQFNAGESRLGKKARGALDPVVQLLRRDPAIEVIVEGHTDDVGTARANMELSERRAKAVAAYLAGGAGMVKNPPLALGFGETKPLYGNSSSEGRRGNRRIVLKLDGGHGCLSNDMLAGIPGLEEIKVSVPTAVVAVTPEADAPQAQALIDAESIVSGESFTEVVGRMSRGHGACGVTAHVIEAIDFKPGGHRLDIEDQRALMPLVTLWREMPHLSIEVLGHTDDIGSAAGNRRLSQRRADSVAQFLLFEAGMAENSPKSTGHGESRPRAVNDTKAGRELNRRIEVLVSGGDKCDRVAATAVQEVPVEEIITAQVSVEEIAIAQVDVEQMPVAVESASYSVSGGGSAAVVESVASCNETELLHTDVKFNTGAYFLNDSSRAALGNVVELMRADPEMQVEVQGHTDNIGAEKRNLSLSERRADAVAQYLMHATGGATNAPIAVGYGADLPLADNAEESGRAQNRRIDILFSGGSSCQQASAQAVVESNDGEASNEWALPSHQVAQLGTQVAAGNDQCVAVQRVVDDLSFEPAGFRLGAQAKNALAPVIEVLRKDPSLMVEVYGYSADYGDAEFDHILAERRAENVADYLMVKSGNFDNLPVAVGFGDLGEGMVADQSGGLYRANRIELRLSKGAACEQPITSDIRIRRPAAQAQSGSISRDVPATAALEIQGGGSAPSFEQEIASCDSSVRVLDGVGFHAGSFELDSDSKLALAQVAAVLVDHPEMRYAVHGHTDAKGDERSNLALSEWRARSVADFLARETGSWPDIANAEGFGESRPLASNDTESGRAVNRRIELEIKNGSC